MRLGEYLRTRTFELVVHGLDIGAASGVDPGFARAPLVDATGLAAEVAVLTGRGPDLLLAMTGTSSAAAGLLRGLRGFRWAWTGHGAPGGSDLACLGGICTSGDRLPPVRWSEALLGGLLGLVGATLAITRLSNWPGWVLLVPAAVLLLGTRRACRLRADAAVVQGRVFRRAVRLRDLRQVGVCLDGRTWLQTQDGEVTLLRMVPLVDYGSGHAGPTPVERLRRGRPRGRCAARPTAARTRATADHEAAAARDLTRSRPR